MTRLLFLAAMAAAVHAGDPAAEVREAAEGWTGAAVKQDKAGLDRYMADDLTYSHANGRTQTKAEYIAAVTNGPARYESFTFSDLKIRVRGEVGILTGFVDVKMVNTDLFRVRTLQVYARNGGKWQMTAHQSARIAR